MVPSQTEKKGLQFTFSGIWPSHGCSSFEMHWLPLQALQQFTSPQQTWVR